MNRSWNEYDTEKLLKNIREGKTIDSISKKEGRSVHSIRSKLKSIAADLYLKHGLPYDQIFTYTGISKESIIIAPIPVTIDKLNDFPEDCNIIDITRPQTPVSETVIQTYKEEEIHYKSICEHLIATFRICADLTKAFSDVAKQISEIAYQKGRSSSREELQS